MSNLSHMEPNCSLKIGQRFAAFPASFVSQPGEGFDIAGKVPEEGHSSALQRSPGVSGQQKGFKRLVPLPVEQGEGKGGKDKDKVGLQMLQKLVMQQTMILQEILRNNQVIQSHIEELNSTIRSITNGEFQTFDTRNTNTNTNTVSSSNSNEYRGPFEMGLFLSGELRMSFKFQLLLENYLELPLYREKNFSLRIKLVDLFGNILPNSNRIPLAISVYSAENPPKEVEFNMTGNKLVKGFSEQDLFRGTCVFQKIQIKEVTSHFRKGWIYLVVSPKGFQSRSSAISSDYVPTQAIKPLVIEKVIVRARKLVAKGELKEKQEADIPSLQQH